MSHTDQTLVLLYNLNEKYLSANSSLDFAKISDLQLAKKGYTPFLHKPY